MIEVSRHARKRAKERLGWRSSTIKRMAEVALKKGITHIETKGRLRKYINGLYRNSKRVHKKTLWITIYGGVVYFFGGSVLVTVYQLPQEFLSCQKVKKDLEL